jgi:hypothetical protein
MDDEQDGSGGSKDAQGGEDVATAQQEVRSETDSGSPNGKREDTKEDWERRYAARGFWTSVAVVAITLVGAGILVCQLRLMQESNALLQTSIVVANRASIGVVEILPKEVVADDPCHVQVHIHNFGGVFADRIVAAMDLRIAASPKGPGAGDETGGHLHPVRAVSTIAPDSDALLRIECEGFPKDVPQLPANLRSGAWRLFVTGLVNYNDGFGLRRTLCFCGVYRWESTRAPAEWEYCERGNAAECAEPKPYSRRPRLVR